MLEQQGNSREQEQADEHANAFGQPEHNRYQAHDDRPYQTGNVSWEAQSGHRGKGPKGYKRSDERIREEVCQTITDDHMIDGSQIEVDVSDGEVILNGTVNQREEKRRVEDLVDRLKGVEHVQNNLRVRKEASSPESGVTAQADRNSAGTTGLRNAEVM